MTAKLKPFSVWQFLLLVLVQQTLLLLALRWLLPSVWQRQISADLLTIILCFIGMMLINCFAEFAFHRYVLHSVCARWLKPFAESHRHHHKLTAIRLRRQTLNPGLMVLNQYPIIKQEQLENSVFPRWSLLAFWGLFTPLLVGLQLLWPSGPILLAGYSAVTWSFISYEIFHYVEHLPLDWWERHLWQPRWGWFWHRVYGFHHMHHANVWCNEAISGFFGLPLADWLFRTYHQPKALFLSGDLALARDFSLRRPWRLIQWLDHLAKRREARLSGKSR